MSRPSDILEIYHYLTRANAECAGCGDAERKALTETIESLQRFLGRVMTGPLRLGTRAAFGSRYEELHRMFTYVVGTSHIQVVPVSLSGLGHKKLRFQSQVFGIARDSPLHGFFGAGDRHSFLWKRLQPDTVTYQGAERDITLERMVRTCFNAAGQDCGGLSAILQHEFGAAFAKVFEKDHVVAWAHALAYAALGHKQDATAFREMTLTIREFQPIGVVSSKNPELDRRARAYVFIE